MIKILYSIYTGEYPNQIAGGPNNIIYKLIQNFNEENYIFDYLSSDLFTKNLTPISLNELRASLSLKKKTAITLFEKSRLYRKFFGSDFYLPYYFYKKHKYYNSLKKTNSSYDIIHAHDSISLSLITDKNSLSKKIMTVHSKGPLSDEMRNMAKNDKLKNSIDKKLKEFELNSIELADIITFPSHAARDYFENSLNIKLNVEKVKIIYNGIDFDKIRSIKEDNVLEKYAIKRKQDQLLLLNIAGHSKEKNINILLEVVSQLKHNLKMDVILLNVGAEGAETNNLRNLAKKLNIEEIILFLGKTKNDDVLRLLKATDIFIMTSEKVIFDLVLLEALACGSCCVVSNEGGNKEIITDDENGYLININDIHEVAKKICALDIDKVKNKALETAKGFSVQKMTNEYIELYKGILNGL